ncbi:hypothetical protein SAMN04488691_11071 [Haloferax larsenii]|uniref:Uncharacterized protein n=1 Tax=Haloferax larsenii TaxID=302484 RepID=A0A1H7TW69_HALLR|nr:hypothetical protein SAMN04488691_11071 [Haloferax larsenii]
MSSLKSNILYALPNLGETTMNWLLGGKGMNVDLEDRDEGEGFDIGKRTPVEDYEICLSQGSGGDVLYIHKP